jgi:hypothetical protein
VAIERRECNTAAFRYLFDGNLEAHSKALAAAMSSIERAGSLPPTLPRARAASSPAWVRALIEAAGRERLLFAVQP